MTETTHVIETDFREEGPGGLRFNTFAAERARKIMAHYICEYHLTESEALNRFDSDGYRFEPSASDEKRWSFRGDDRRPRPTRARTRVRAGWCF